MFGLKNMFSLLLNDEIKIGNLEINDILEKLK